MSVNIRVMTGETDLTVDRPTAKVRNIGGTVLSGGAQTEFRLAVEQVCRAMDWPLPTGWGAA